MENSILLPQKIVLSGWCPAAVFNPENENMITTSSG